MALATQIAENRTLSVALDGSPAAREPKRTLYVTGFQLIFVLCICFISYSGFNEGFFRADDLLVLRDGQSFLAGNANVFWQSLFVPWLHDPVYLNCWRPLVHLTFFADALLWKFAASGYLLTNFALHATSACAVYFLCKRLLTATSSPDTVNGVTTVIRPDTVDRVPDAAQLPISIIPLLAASLFAASPLTVEPVLWISARSDILAGLLSFCLLIFFSLWMQNQRGVYFLLSLGAFAAGTLCKEVSVVMLPVLFCYGMLFADSSRSHALGARTSSSALLNLKTASHTLYSLRYFVIWLALYMVLRICVLGGLGGYTLPQPLERVFWSGSLLKLFYPINEDAVSKSSNLWFALKLAYGCIAVLLSTFAITRPWKDASARRPLLFLFSWLLISLVASSPVWCLNANLVGSRAFYTGAGPFYMLLAVALLSPLLTMSRHAPTTIARQVLRGTVGTLTFASLLLLCCTEVLSTRSDIAAWNGESEELRQVQQQTISALAELPRQEKLLLANVPASRNGAPLFCWYEMLTALVSPPLTADDISSRVCLVEPSNWGPDIYPPTKVARLINGGKLQLFCWHSKTGTLSFVNLPEPVSAPAEVAVKCLSSSFRSEQLDDTDYRSYLLTFSEPVHPFSIQSLRVEMAARARSTTSLNSPWRDPFALEWSPAERPMIAKLYADGTPRTYNFYVAQNKAALGSSPLKTALLHVPGDCAVTYLRVRIDDGQKSIPAFVPALNEDADGVCRTGSPTGLNCSFDVSSIPEARSVVLEMTKRLERYCWDSSTYRDEKLCTHALLRVDAPGTKGKITIPRIEDRKPDRYQARIFALDALGQEVGTASDPVIVEFD